MEQILPFFVAYLCVSYQEHCTDCNRWQGYFTSTACILSSVFVFVILYSIYRPLTCHTYTLIYMMHVNILNRSHNSTKLNILRLNLSVYIKSVVVSSLILITSMSAFSDVRGHGTAWPSPWSFQYHRVGQMFITFTCSLLDSLTFSGLSENASHICQSQAYTSRYLWFRLDALPVAQPAVSKHQMKSVYNE